MVNAINGLSSENLRIGGRSLTAATDKPLSAPEGVNGQATVKGKALGLLKKRVSENAASSAVTFHKKTSRNEPALYNKRGLLKSNKAPLAPRQASTVAQSFSETPFKDLQNTQTKNLQTGTALTISTSGALVAGKGDVIVDINASSSGYNNKIYYSTDNFETRHYIGIDNQIGSYNIGSFAEGTLISFGIDNGQGNFFRTGAAEFNPDNLVHARTSTTASGTTVAFEDLFGGGDNDFNDAVITVRSAEPTTATPEVPLDFESGIKQNRSGLGDGTNPGQGAGRLNAKNEGTHNPTATYQALSSTEQDRVVDITV